jgi:hypothetical protein
MLNFVSLMVPSGWHLNRNLTTTLIVVGSIVQVMTFYRLLAHQYTAARTVHVDDTLNYVSDPPFFVRPFIGKV